MYKFEYDVYHILALHKMIEAKKVNWKISRVQNCGFFVLFFRAFVYVYLAVIKSILMKQSKEEVEKN